MEKDCASCISYNKDDGCVRAEECIDFNQYYLDEANERKEMLEIIKDLSDRMERLIENNA